jgi:hypothetical protein
MADTLANLAESRVAKSSRSLSADASAQEAQEAVRAAFPYEGDLRLRHLWSGRGVARYRANWFRQVDGETRLVTSLFLGIRRTADGLVVQNETALA